MTSLTIRKTVAADLADIIKCERKYPEFVGQWAAERHLAALEEADCAHLTVSDEAGFAGFVILKGLQNPNHNIELMRIAVDAPDRGYGKTLLEQIKGFAFERLSAHRLWLDVRENNTRAQKAYETAGFVKEGRLRECVLVNGRYESLYIMSVLKGEYRKA